MPVVNSVVILSAFLMRRLSMPLRLPVGTIFLSEKNSVSIRSKLFGAVTARLLTSSVVTATYWMAMPVSAWNAAAATMPVMPASSRRRGTPRASEATAGELAWVSAWVSDMGELLGLRKRGEEKRAKKKG